MLFALICTDRRGGLETRQATRPDHLAFLDGLGDDLMFAGPFLDGDGKPNGSLVVVRAETHEAAEAIAALDPYARADLFETVEIRAWNWALKAPEGV
ncbi:MAG: hypothetical protein KDJ19_11510 [Hyphomicrobiaceae bacterium]|nr:hypothetical protein [Hyphomicrobiaceae bacterium]MCC0024984.1 hypothetical protein [Hyphomicrobiaceae bacterium]